MFGFLIDLLVKFTNGERCEEGDVHVGRCAGTLVRERILGDRTLRAESP